MAKKPRPDNGPSTTGKHSGGGRGNNSPKPKPKKQGWSIQPFL